MVESRGPSPMPGRFMGAGPYDAVPHHHHHHHHNHHPRRQRPPDPGAIAAVDTRVPLREEKVQRRESRMGLRNIFTRSTKNLRDSKEDKERERERERMKDVPENHHHHHHHHHDHQEHYHPQPQQQPHHHHHHHHRQQTQPQPIPQPHHHHQQCPLHPQPLHPQHARSDSLGPGHAHPSHPQHIRNSPSRSGLRASILDFSQTHWPSSSSVDSRLEAPLPDVPPSDEPPQPQRAATGPQPSVIRRQKSGTLPSRPPRVAADTPWTPPPLFQAYPQAIKYIHLRAPTISGDSLLRLTEKNEKKGASSVRDDINQQHSPGLAPPPDEQSAAAAAEKGGERERRKLRHHRRHQSASLARFEWTTKIYVLVTSGYLLQYPGAGPFDRQPEKILSLTKDSAAFASDMIPGKHWVLHVASHMEAENNSSDPAPSRSLLARLRVTDRRHASNFFMVFEDGDDMESWIFVLRKEIEAMGGKKNLAETATGQPDAAEHGHSRGMSVDDGVRTKTSQRTLVVRDPNRFSRTMSPPDLGWAPSSLADSINSDDGHTKKSYERSDRALDPERPSQETTTDVSSTNSFMSHDNLREAHQRLSFISSGQRTAITSPGSSPAPSPMKDVFTSNKDAMAHSHQPLFIHEQSRARPNATEISERRQSLRAGNPFLGDMAIFAKSGAPAALAQYSEPAAPLYQPIQAMPNFSVPHALGRRGSFVRAATAELDNFENSQRQGRRPPPPPLPLNPRSSSVIADRGPPKPIPIALSRRSSMRQEDVLTPSSVQCHLRRRSSVESAHLLSRQASPSRPVGLQSYDGPANSPRKYASMHTLRSQSISSAPLLPAFDMSRPKPKRDSLPPIPRIPGSPSGSPLQTPKQFLQVPVASPQRLGPPTPPAPIEMGRCASSLGIHGEGRSRSPSFSSPGRRCRKRASLQVLPSVGASVPRSMTTTDALGIMVPTNHVASFMVSNARAATASMHAGLDLSHHSGPGNRRSLQQLAEGPPPAPPPTCALPPIPQKPSPKS